MNSYLIEYHRPTRVWRMTEFLGPRGHIDAIYRRVELEDERPDEDWEIVALNAKSFETVQHTHSRYFSGRRLEPRSA